MQRRNLFLALAAAPLRAMAQSQSLTSYVQQHGAANVFAQVQQLAHGHAGWLLLSRQWMTPGEILPACARLSLDTVASVEAFAVRVGQTLSFAQVEALTRDTRPAGFDQAELPTISVGALHVDVIAAQARAAGNCGLTADHVGRATDGAKRLPTEAQWDELLGAFPYGEPDMEFRYGLRECEEYARAFMGWLGRIGMGDLAIGEAWLVMFANGQQLPSGHVTCIGATQSRTAWWLDPIERKRRPLSFVGFRGYRGVWSNNCLEPVATSCLIQTVML